MCPTGAFGLVFVVDAVEAIHLIPLLWVASTGIAKNWQLLWTGKANQVARRISEVCHNQISPWILYWAHPTGPA